MPPQKPRFVNSFDSHPVHILNGQPHIRPGIIHLYDNQPIQPATTRRQPKQQRQPSSPEILRTPPPNQSSPFQTKLTPQASLSSAERLELNFKVIQRHDPTISRILDQIPYAILYKYTIVRDGANTSGAWEKSEMEGSMFLFERQEQPRYGFFILNRNGLGNLVQNFHKDDQFELSDDEKYIIYRASGKLPNNGKVNSPSIDPAVQLAKPVRPSPVGLWVSDPQARKRVTEFIFKLRAHIQRTDSPMEVEVPSPPTRPNFNTSDNIVSASEERVLDKLFAPFLASPAEIDITSPPLSSAITKPSTSTTDLTGQALLASMFQSAAIVSSPEISKAPPPKRKGKEKEGAAGHKVRGGGINVLDEMFAAARAEANGMSSIKSSDDPAPQHARTPSPPQNHSRSTTMDSDALGRLLGMHPYSNPIVEEDEFDEFEIKGSDQDVDLDADDDFDEGDDELTYPITATPLPVSSHQGSPDDDLFGPLQPNLKQHHQSRASPKNEARRKASKKFQAQNEQYIPQNSARASKLDREVVVEVVGDALDSVDSGIINGSIHEDGQMLERNDFVREVLTLIHTDGTFVDELYGGYLQKLRSSHANGTTPDKRSRNRRTRRR